MGGGGGAGEATKWTNPRFGEGVAGKRMICIECVVPHDSAHSTDHWTDSLTSTSLPRPVYLDRSTSPMPFLRCPAQSPRRYFQVFPCGPSFIMCVHSHSLIPTAYFLNLFFNIKKNGYSEHASRRDFDL